MFHPRKRIGRSGRRKEKNCNNGKKAERTDKKAKRREKGTESPPSIRMLYGGQVIVSEWGGVLLSKNTDFYFSPFRIKKGQKTVKM
jgi:hypothetical protein